MVMYYKNLQRVTTNLHSLYMVHAFTHVFYSHTFFKGLKVQTVAPIIADTMIFFRTV
jgi:hypothetical protein